MRQEYIPPTPFPFLSFHVAQHYKAQSASKAINRSVGFDICACESWKESHDCGTFAILDTDGYFVGGALDGVGMAICDMRCSLVCRVWSTM